MDPHKLILTNFQAPGDVVMLTAAVRDLHRCYPGQFLTDVQTCCPELWENNPYLTSLELDDPEAKVLPCHYPWVRQSNERPMHFLHGFIEHLNARLGLQIRPTLFKGDIHLSCAEKEMPSLVTKTTGVDLPYWIVAAGGKYDITVKWWHFRRWQAVVDHFRNRVLFVQVGEKHHYHPALHGVLDLRGKTRLRGLIHLVYHSQGVLCPLTLLMHLAAAVECGESSAKSRPCVVVAGGRESPHWAAYPTHQFIHTVGLLPCCAGGGCWRSRAVPLDDGDEKDDPKHLCVDTVQNLPRCMYEITPEDVIDRIERYLRGRSLTTLSPDQAREVGHFLSRPAARTGFENYRTAPAVENGAALQECTLNQYQRKAECCED
jgi:ADP-heptose:LPS heptosyltransferase